MKIIKGKRKSLEGKIVKLSVKLSGRAKNCLAECLHRPGDSHAQSKYLTQQGYLNGEKEKIRIVGNS
jgi:hypothetical protein